MDRIYYHFPQEVDLERHYGFNRDMKYLVRVMASLNGRTGRMEMDTQGPNVKRNPDSVKARRDLAIAITDQRLDFLPLDAANTDKVLSAMPEKGTVDFRVTVGYTYMDKNFDKMSLADDVFLVRAAIGDDLSLRIANVHGQGRTVAEEVADTIEAAITHFRG